MGPDGLLAEWVDGAPRRLSSLDEGRAEHLGRVLAAVHARRSTATGGPASWGARARTPVAYARARGRDAQGRARSEPERLLVREATARAARACSPRPGGFALLHGDLVEGNIVWTRGGPVLVDWEFWRMGDPAEDLAYVMAVNSMPARARRALLGGYAGTDGLVARTRAWEPLVLADAGLWYAAHGDAARAGDLLARARAQLRPGAGA